MTLWESFDFFSPFLAIKDLKLLNDVLFCLYCVKFIGSFLQVKSWSLNIYLVDAKSNFVSVGGKKWLMLQIKVFEVS